MLVGRAAFLIEHLVPTVTFSLHLQMNFHPAAVRQAEILTQKILRTRSLQNPHLSFGDSRELHLLTMPVLEAARRAIYPTRATIRYTLRTTD